MSTSRRLETQRRLLMVPKVAADLPTPADIQTHLMMPSLRHQHFPIYLI